MKRVFRALDHWRDRERIACMMRCYLVLKRLQGLPDPSSGASFLNRACAKAALIWAAKANRLPFWLSALIRFHLFWFYSRAGVYVWLPPAEKKNKTLEGGSTAFIANEDKVFMEWTSVQMVHVYRKCMYVLVHIDTNPPSASLWHSGWRGRLSKGVVFPRCFTVKTSGPYHCNPCIVLWVLIQDSVTAYVSVSFIRVAHNPGLVLPTYHKNLLRKEKEKDYCDWQSLRWMNYD